MLCFVVSIIAGLLKMTPLCNKGEVMCCLGLLGAHGLALPRISFSCATMRRAAHLSLVHSNEQRITCIVNNQVIPHHTILSTQWRSSIHRVCILLSSPFFYSDSLSCCYDCPSSYSRGDQEHTSTHANDDED